MKPLAYLTLSPAAALLCLAPVAAAANDILGACDAEIAGFCASVAPGNGRLAACLYAHEDKLGEACDAAVGDHGDMLDMVFEEIRFISQECAGDIRQHCATEAEKGGVFGCLQAQRASLGEGCAAVVDRLPMHSE